MIDVNAGVGHLNDKLRCIKLDSAPHRHGASLEDTQVVSEETVEEVLGLCEHKIAKLMELVAATDGQENGERAEPIYNPDIRVRIDQQADDGDFDAINNGEGEVFNRQLFKKNSDIFVEKSRKKNALVKPNK